MLKLAALEHALSLQTANALLLKPHYLCPGFLDELEQTFVVRLVMSRV